MCFTRLRFATYTSLGIMTRAKKSMQRMSEGEGVEEAENGVYKLRRNERRMRAKGKKGSTSKKQRTGSTSYASRLLP